MKAANQRSHYMAIERVVIITRSIEIGGHQTNRIEAMLPSQGLTELDPSNLRNRVPLIGGLQGAGQ